MRRLQVGIVCASRHLLRLRRRHLHSPLSAPAFATVTAATPVAPPTQRATRAAIAAIASVAAITALAAFSPTSTLSTRGPASASCRPLLGPAGRGCRLSRP